MQPFLHYYLTAQAAALNEFLLRGLEWIGMNIFTTQKQKAPFFLTVHARCTADGSSALRTVLWVLISVLFCQGKASLPLSADLADCSHRGCMSASLRNVQSRPNL